jgi:hypothetical protein
MGSDLADKPNWYILMYTGTIWALLLIPNWTALARKHRRRFVILALSLATGIGWFYFPLRCLAGWIAVLVWAIMYQPQPPPYQQPPVQLNPHV